MRRSRLDAELVRRGLARSREQAAELVRSGRVQVGGQTATKSATAVDPAAALLVDCSDGQLAYVSRGGDKLAGALDQLLPSGPTIRGRRCLDAGASTGGFTDVLLRRGAAEVTAVDVGYGQLAWSLRGDARVRVLDRTNVRTLTADHIGGPVDVVVADLSFIGLARVLPSLARCAAEDADLLPLVKPQFEAGRGRVGAGGVVRDPAVRTEAVTAAAECAQEYGLGVRAVVASPLPGPAGNVEYFLWLRADAPALDPSSLRRLVSDAVLAGPS